MCQCNRHAPHTQKGKTISAAQRPSRGGRHGAPPHLMKERTMKTKLLLAAALLVVGLSVTTTTASAQGYFGGNDGGMGRSHGVMPNPGPYRAINHDPATGRTYAKEAGYLPIKQLRRKTKR